MPVKHNLPVVYSNLKILNKGIIVINLKFFVIAAALGIAFGAAVGGSVNDSGIIFSEPFQNGDNLKKYNQGGIDARILPEADSGGSALCIAVPERGNVICLDITLDVAQLAGRRVEFSADIRGENVAPAKIEWNGGKFILHAVAGSGREIWQSAIVKRGTFGWERIKFTADLPADLRSARLMLGFQDSFGKLFFRNLKVVEKDIVVDLTKVVNMGFADDVAGNGKGGWSDQGPDNDARNFKYQNKTDFANIPFSIINPANNDGKSILVMSSPQFKNGPQEAAIQFKSGAISGKYLYLFHTLCYGGAKVPVGTIEMKGVNGKSKTIEVFGERDVTNWWGAKKVANGYPGATWTTGAGGTVALYASRFELDPELGNFASITFRSSGKSPVWLIAAATISNNKYDFPASVKVLVKPDQTWQALPGPSIPAIRPGTALDRSWLNSEKTQERVIVNADGLLAFAGSPDRPVRFLSGVEATDSFWGRGGVAPAQFGTHEHIAEYARQLKLHGYNLTRTHYLDAVLMKDAKQDFEFNPEMLDRFDYFVKCLKENNIYLNMDAMSSPLGYETGNPWSPDPKKRSFKFDIYFSDHVKENWKQGVKKLLTHINPYTKTRLIDEPMLAMMTGFNEQEFAFFNDEPNRELMAPYWQRFLERKYGTVEKFKTAWGKAATAATNWNQIQVFSIADTSGSDIRGIDVAEFIVETERGIYAWYQKELREIGFKGLVANFDMGQSLRQSIVRNGFSLVFMHAYHAHPTNYMLPGSTIDQTSSIASASAIFRGLNSTKLLNTPIAVTEYCNVFWNRYRYEQAFVNGAYAALQNYSGLTFFAQPVTVVPVDHINPFSGMIDPMMKASEFLTAYFFIRGDVRPADSFIRLNLDSKQVLASGSSSSGIHSGQSRLSLITGLNTAVDSKEPMRKREMGISSSGGSMVMNNVAGYTRVIDSQANPFDIDALVGELKKQNLIPADNRTRGLNEIFESATGELYMDCRRNFMSVNTPRSQGVCAEAGTAAALTDFKVEKLTARGNLTVVSIDGLKPIAKSSRMVLVYATDALNSNMVFDDPERRILRDIGGKGPALVAVGEFTVKIRNANAARLKLYALDLDGTRRCELPLTVKDGEAIISINTAKISGGPALFFELAATS